MLEAGQIGASIYQSPSILLVSKLDIDAQDNRRFIAGYANVHSIVDNQDDLVTRKALEEAWAKLIKSPDFALCQLMHSNIAIAKIVIEEVVDSNGNVHRSGVDDRGLYIVAQVRDDIQTADEVWKKIEAGQLRGFSIGGRNLSPGQIECTGDRCYNLLTSLELYEVSIVDRPANKVSIFNLLKCDEKMDDTLFKLAEATKNFSESTLIEGIIQVSKLSDTDGKYDLYACTEKGTSLCNELSLYLATQPDLVERFNIVEELDPEKEYVKLFDLSLSRPFTAVTEEDGTLALTSSSKTDKPQTEGKTPMDKEENKEVEKETEESQKGDSGIPETEIPSEEAASEEVEEKADEDEEEQAEAIAPITLEALIAEVAQLNERFGAYLKSNSPPEEEEEKVEKAETPEAVVETPPKEPDEAVVEAPVEQTVEEVPTVDVETPPEAEVEPVVETPLPAIVPDVETRGRAVDGTEGRLQGFNVADIARNVSMDDIRNLEREIAERRR
jgi:HK97 family phage prohead protease